MHLKKVKNESRKVARELNIRILRDIIIVFFGILS